LLLCNLREHEIELNRLVVQESDDKHIKGIALNACNHKKQQDSSESDEDIISLLSRKFSKFLKKNKIQASKRYNSKKPNDFNLNKYTCYGCGEKGHIKVECPTMKARIEQISKAKEGEKPRRHMFNGMIMRYPPLALLMMKKQTCP